MSSPWHSGLTLACRHRLLHRKERVLVRGLPPQGLVSLCQCHPCVLFFPVVSETGPSRSNFSGQKVFFCLFFAFIRNFIADFKTKKMIKYCKVQFVPFFHYPMPWLFLMRFFCTRQSSSKYCFIINTVITVLMNYYY